jgi:hypothetical protein
MSSCVNWAFFYARPTSAKKAKFTQEREQVTFIKIRSHRRKFSNSDSVEQKIYFLHFLLDDNNRNSRRNVDRD